MQLCSWPVRRQSFAITIIYDLIKMSAHAILWVYSSQNLKFSIPWFSFLTFHMPNCKLPIVHFPIKVLLVFHQWLSATIKFCKGILQKYLDILTTPGPNWWRRKAWHFFGIDRKTSLTSSESIKAGTNKIITQELIALAKKVLMITLKADGLSKTHRNI